MTELKKIIEEMRRVQGYASEVLKLAPGLNMHMTNWADRLSAIAEHGEPSEVWIGRDTNHSPWKAAASKDVLNTVNIWGPVELAERTVDQLEKAKAKIATLELATKLCPKYGWSVADALDQGNCEGCVESIRCGTFAKTPRWEPPRCVTPPESTGSRRSSCCPRRTGTARASSGSPR